MESRELGSVKVSPSVLSTLVHLTATGVPGVVAVGDGSPGVLGFLRRCRNRGIALRLAEDGVHVDIDLIVRQGVNVVEVGNRVQAEIAKAVDKMVGLAVQEVNVRVVDVR